MGLDGASEEICRCVFGVATSRPEKHASIVYTDLSCESHRDKNASFLGNVNIQISTHKLYIFAWGRVWEKVPQIRSEIIDVKNYTPPPFPLVIGWWYSIYKHIYFQVDCPNSALNTRRVVLHIIHSIYVQYKQNNTVQYNRKPWNTIQYKTSTLI